jgi:hypothetical protein
MTAGKFETAVLRVEIKTTAQTFEVDFDFQV